MTHKLRSSKFCSSCSTHSNQWPQQESRPDVTQQTTQHRSTISTHFAADKSLTAIGISPGAQGILVPKLLIKTPTTSTSCRGHRRLLSQLHGSPETSWPKLGTSSSTSAIPAPSTLHQVVLLLMRSSLCVLWVYAKTSSKNKTKPHKKPQQPVQIIAV